jgi:hypothetical protein
LLLLLLQFGSVDDVLAVYGHQQQLYGFASMGVQTTLIHALLKAHARGSPGNQAAYEAWRRLRGSGRQLDAQALLAGVRLGACAQAQPWVTMLNTQLLALHGERRGVTAAAGTCPGSSACLRTAVALTLILLLLLLCRHARVCVRGAAG